MRGRPFLLPSIWALFILILCGIPGRDIPHFSFLDLLAFDKWVHAGIFFVLVLLLVRGLKLRGGDNFIVRNSRLFSFTVAMLYGGLLEILQGTIFEERSADLNDFIANTTGAAAAAALYPFLSKRISFFHHS